MNLSDIVIRQAEIKDVDFIATTIVEAEKGLSNKCGLANYFGLSEQELHGYVRNMLEEEVDGCEFSLSSFHVAEHDGKVVSARGGWKEGDNEDELPSAILKANLLSYCLPAENIKIGLEHKYLTADFQTVREKDAFQLEYSYTLSEYRGNHLMYILDDFYVEKARAMGCKKIQAHVFADNVSSLKSCYRHGFVLVKTVVSSQKNIKEFYSDDKLLLLEKVL